MAPGLIIVDIQNDYFEDGKMPLMNPDKAANNAAKILQWFRKNDKDNIFHIQHIAEGPAMGYFIPDTVGAEIHASVSPLDGEDIVIKHFPNSFLQTDLEDKLRAKNITKVIIIGMMTHMCVDATARTATDLGFETTVIEDACATLDLTYEDDDLSAEKVHDSFIGALNGVYATITSTENFLNRTK